MSFSPLIYDLVGIAMSVHNELGNRHPEYVYHGAMNASLSKGDWEFDGEPVLDIVFRGEVIAQYRPDGLVKEERERFQMAALKAAQKAVQRRDWEEAAWQAALSCIAEDPDGDPIQMLIAKGVVTQEEMDKLGQKPRFDAQRFIEKIRHLPSEERYRIIRKDLLQNARTNDPAQFAEYVTKICLAEPDKNPAQFLADWGVMTLKEARTFLYNR